MRAVRSGSALLMIVDDDALNREAMAHALSARGFRVVEHDSGAAAFEALRVGEPPDLIVLDLVMPEMDGWEFRRRQLADSTLATIPVVAMSGDRSAKAAAVHAAAFLSKPLESLALLRTVEQVLARPRKRALRRSFAPATARARRPVAKGWQRRFRSTAGALPAPACEADPEQITLISRGVSHVVNNALQGLMSYAQCAGGLDNEPELRQAVFGAALQCAVVLRRLADCALPYTGRSERGELGRFEPFAAWRSLCPDNVELHVRDLHLLHELSVAAELLLAVTCELIGNAVEAIGCGAGAVYVRISHAQRGAHDLQAALPARNRRCGRWCCIEVADNGCGIGAAELARIWLPFYSTKFAGRGLGLAVVFARISALGGLVEARSRRGEGAAIRLLLPLAEDTQIRLRTPGGEEGAE